MAFNSTRVINNTLILYIRLFVVILLSFFTTRVLLQALGVDDFGVYSVVGGILAMFASLKSAFSSATQRFYNYEKGKSGSIQNIRRLFNSSLLIHFIVAVVLVILIEIVGVYAVNYILDIPNQRLYAANIILQLSIVAMVFSTMSIPFDAMVMAHERMNFYAVLSVLDSVIKLSLILFLRYMDVDRLIYYGYIMLGVSILNFIILTLYCRRNFEECRISFTYKKSEFIDMATFGGWNFLGNVGFSICHEVNNFFLNIFGGVVANAARGVVYQIRNAIMSFLSNTLVALRPQATQEFAAKNVTGFFRVVYMSTKMVYFIALCMAVPLFIYANNIFAFWLDEVPEYAVTIMRISIIHMMIRSFHEPIDLIFKSVGELKKYQLISLFSQAIVLPVTYLLLKLDFNIYIIFINMCFAEVLELVLIVRHARNYGLEIKEYFSKSILPIILTTILSIVISFGMSSILDLNFILEIIIVVIAIVICIYLLGLTRYEKVLVLHSLRKMIKK